MLRMSNTLFESQHYTMRLTPKETEPLSLSLSLLLIVITLNICSQNQRGATLPTV